MSSSKSETVLKILRAVVLLIVALLLAVSCSDGNENQKNGKLPEQETEVMEETTSHPTTGLETTEDTQPPEVTLGDDSGGEPDVMIRLEGDPRTTFSGLCSVGAEQNVLSGQVPKRFEFDLKGRQLSCRIEKRDNGKGDLKVVLIAGEATRSVQQTNAPGNVIKVSYEE